MAKSRVQCLDRTLDILEVLGRKGETTASELAAETGLNSATVHNILVTLAARNYLICSKGRYSFGPGMEILSSQWSPAASLRILAPARLDAITASTGESAVAAIMSGLKTVFVATTPGSSEIVVRFPKLIYDYPLGLATGRLLTAFADERLKMEILRSHLDAKLDSTTEAEWLEMLSAIRKTGHCILKFKGSSSHSVSALVRGGDGIVIGALGAYSPSFNNSAEHIEEMLESVKKESRILSEQFGYNKNSGKEQ